MKALLNIGMFLVPPLMAYILHMGNANRKGGGYDNRRKRRIFLLYMLSVNACTYLVSCARGIKTFSFEQMTISYRMKYMGLGFAFGLLFGFVSSRTRSVKYGAEQRNYELDFLKFIFTICVFMSHTGVFRKENTNIILPPQFGQVSVFFFFVVSGMLMANSILKKEINTADYGKLAVMFVINKIKTLALDVYAALFVFMAVYIFTIPLNKIPGELVKMVPELFFVTRAGISITYNVPGWYLSAMFLAMLPLAYLLYKNRDFTLHILAPILAVFILGWLCQTNDYCFPDQHKMHGLFLGGMYSAVSGLCFGICAYNMYIRIGKAKMNENGRMFLTVTEVLLYGVFFGTWFLLRNNRMIMSAILLLPVAAAITFSGKSYITGLFRYEWMKYFAPLSLTIYLNQWIGRVLVQKYFAERSYGFCVSMMAFIMLCSCLLSTLTKRISKYVWKEKLKTVFTNCV